ncbi:hypothetical protein N9K67_06050 [Opitutaceae bacterium]|nr:hypothetical protein [Opitutaceae bacterium]
MNTSDTFQTIKSEYGHYASWAVWAAQGETPKSNIDDLSILNIDENPALLESLQRDLIFLGLNISRPIERPLGNFHDPRPMATDFKIRYALQDTPYWGGYMTDIIKDFEEKASGKMMKYLRSDPDFERENIEVLRSEIRVLGCSNPLIIAFGKDTELIARRNLGKDFTICRIPHYANYTSKEKYREQVLDVLDKMKAEQGGGLNAQPREPPRTLGEK